MCRENWTHGWNDLPLTRSYVPLSSRCFPLNFHASLFCLRLVRVSIPSPLLPPCVYLCVRASSLFASMYTGTCMPASSVSATFSAIISGGKQTRSSVTVGKKKRLNAPATDAGRSKRNEQTFLDFGQRSLGKRVRALDHVVEITIRARPLYPRNNSNEVQILAGVLLTCRTTFHLLALQ